MSFPSKFITPAEGFNIPEIVFKRVVFPAPLAPTNVTISPLFTLSDIPLIASILP